MHKPELPFHKEDFFFNDREKRLFFLALKIVLGVVGVAVVVVIIAFVAGGAARSESTAMDLPNAQASPLGAVLNAETESGFTKPLGISAFLIPDDRLERVSPDHYIFREHVGVWTQEMVDRYWIRPSQIGLENLTRRNDKQIKELFESVK
ncbi:MAG TPA: hypothetical protein ENN69_06705 [Spirochaetia bacterium]|nr:hypothetical protein [Spirochaetia bacterium]